MACWAWPASAGCKASRYRAQSRIEAALVQPVSVVDEHRCRCGVRVLGKQAQGGRADREPVVRLGPAGARARSPEPRTADRGSCRSREGPAARRRAPGRLNRFTGAWPTTACPASTVLFGPSIRCARLEPESAARRSASSRWFQVALRLRVQSGRALPSPASRGAKWPTRASRRRSSVGLAVVRAARDGARIQAVTHAILPTRQLPRPSPSRRIAGRQARAGGSDVSRVD